MPPRMLKTNVRLTQTEHDLKLSMTWEGMAHFAHSGPAERTCRECKHWACHGKRHADGELVAVSCRRFKGLMGRRGCVIPHHAGACSRFELAEKIYAPFKKEKELA